MTFRLVSEIFTDEQMLNGEAEAWLQLQDPDNVCSVMQTQHGTATVMITIIYGEGIGIGEAYNSSLSSLKVIEQAPVDQQVLDELLLNAVTAGGASTAVQVLDKKNLTMMVVASGVTSGGNVAFEISPDGTNWASVNTINANSNGVHWLTPDIGIVKYVRANLTRTDGTFTVYLFGRA